MSNVYKGTVSVLAILTISCVAFIAIANADDKANSTNAENAVAVPQTANLTPAQKFFANMSPEEFRNPIALDDFISRFPNSPEARVVFAIRFSLVEKFPTIEGYNDFIKKYPDKLQTQVAIQEVFKLYCEQNRVAGYYDFIQRYPNTEQSLVAMMYIQEIMFQYACQLDTEEEYDAFIEAFPDAPQVKAAQEKAKGKAIEKEKRIREDLENKVRKDLEKKYEGKDKKDIENEIKEAIKKELEDKLNPAITLWQGEQPDKINTDTNSQEDNISLDEWLRAYKWHRQAKVYQNVYPGIGNIGEIQRTLNEYKVIVKLNKIETTLNDNHEKLIKKLGDVSKNITKKLGEIANNQMNIREKLEEGFNNLHQDLQQIHKDLKVIDRSVKETNKQLAKLNGKLDAIADLFQVAVTGNPLPMFNYYAEKINNFTNSFEPDDIEGVPFDFIEYRKSISRPMEQIALRGYENITKSLFENTEVGVFIETMKGQWRKLPKMNTCIGKFLGNIVENILVFVPYIGPSIAHKAGEAVEYYVDDILVPYVLSKFDEFKDNIELCKVVFKEYKELLLKAAQDWIITFVDNNLPPELVEKFKNIIENTDVKDVKSFVELVKQVAREIINEVVVRETTTRLPLPDLKHTIETLLYNVCYIR